MQLNQRPAKIAAIFASAAAAANRNTVPLTAAGTTQPGQASFDVGFPAITMQPASAGGINPYGQDFNGILNAVTAGERWHSAGGSFPFDASFAATIGGYPIGAILLRADGTGFWLNRADNNLTNPDADANGMASSWVTFAPDWTDGVDTGLANAYVVNYTPAVTRLVDGMVLRFRAKTANTGISTLNVNGLGATQLRGGAFEQLQGGEIVPGGYCHAVYSGLLLMFILKECTGGALQIAPALNSSHAMRLSQIPVNPPRLPIAASNTTLGNQSTVTASVSFSVPSSGLLIAFGIRNNAFVAGFGSNATLFINGVAVATDSTELTTMHSATQPTNAGTVSASYVAASGAYFSAAVHLLYIPNV